MIIEIGAFFLIGLTGGFGHCVLMCHPFVLYISSKYIGSKTGYSLIVPHIYYNIGRITTYTILGGIAGLFGGVVQYAGRFAHIQRLSAIIGGSLLIIFALYSLFGRNISLPFRFIDKIRHFEPAHPILAGLLLGFLPCGLSMGAIIGAATSGSFLSGALLVAAFGLGTSAALLILAVFGNIAIAYSKALRKIGTILLLIMGIYFIIMGLRF